MTETLLTFVQAANLAGMPSQNFNYYVKKNKAPPFEMVMGRKAFKASDVLEWVEELKKKNKGKK